MFKQHGKSSITLNAPVLEVTLTGPFNLGFFERLHVDLGQYSSEVSPLVLLMLSGEALIDKQAINSHIEFWQQYNIKAVAICLESCVSSIVTQCVFEHIFEEAMVYHHFFQQNIDARAWLDEIQNNYF